MAKKADVKIDRKAFYPIMKNANTERVLFEAAKKLQLAAGENYQVITENQERKTRAVIAVGSLDPRALFDEATEGTLARAVASLEQPWSQ